MEDLPAAGAEEGPVNILLVDDQPGKLLGYQAILADLGENLVLADSARSALEILLRSEVAVLVVDVVMPDVDGFELVEMIRTHPRFESIPVIFVSGVHLSDIDRIRGYSAGAVDYLPVPIVPELLRAKVRIFADLYRKTRGLEALNHELEARIAARTAELEAATRRWKASEERLRLALMAARAGAWEWHFSSGSSAQKRGEMRWSPELFALFGLPAYAPVPTIAEFLAHVDGEDRERVDAELRSLPNSTGGSRSFDFEFRFHRSGEATPVWIRAAGTVVTEPRGRPVVARGIYKDVTSRKHTELELELERQRKDEVLITLGHELRNPLAPILNCVRMLKSDVLDSAAKARHQDILEGQVLHLVRLLDDLLEVSRISRGTISLSPRPTDLSEVVRGAVEATLSRASGHVLVTQIPEQGPFAAVDPQRMAQVVSHLLDNAVKFTPTGGRILVELSQDSQDAVLRVVDSGVGIAPQHLERVFDMFARIDRLGGGGLGIGLALVRRLLELQAGRVSVHSDGEGRGTEVVVRLPCLAGQRIDDDDEQSTPKTEFEPVRFLVVDDNPVAADTLAELLELSGCSARAAYCGEAAIREGESFEPDIVLLDLGMPRMDGFETAQRLRETPWGGRTKLIAVTGWGQTSDRKRTADAGFDEHLVKPVDLEVVLGLIELLDR